MNVEYKLGLNDAVLTFNECRMLGGESAYSVGTQHIQVRDVCELIPIDFF